MAGLLLGSPGQAAPESREASASRRFFYCDVPLREDAESLRAREQMRFDAALDGLHAFAYLGIVGALELGADQHRIQRWSKNNRFDDGLRSGFRGDSASAREALATAGDWGLALSAGIIPAATLGAHFARNHDCLETWDMATDWAESLSLSLLMTQATKLVVGRQRPYGEECGDGSPPRDARCGSSDRSQSFFSGHASMAAAGAGVTCAFSFKREAWGSATRDKVAPCAVGVTAALATGLIRIAADQHWGSDILVGFVVGGAIGYFDTWGPLDLLRFTTRNSRGRVSSTGMILPRFEEGRLGAQLVMVF